ncbi:MAG TPA: hypothetical protein VIF02_05155 [Methylocella sp.]|jgi:hypothetical protein
MDLPPVGEIRNATRDDVGVIFSILASVSPEIPVKMDTEGERECIREIIDQCCDQQISWITLGQIGDVVGFLLGKNYSRITKSGMKFDGITLPYGGVLTEHRGHRYFSGLLDRAKAMKIPLHAVVKRDNRSDMAARLVKKGFVEMPNFPRRPDEDVYIWTPQ